MTSYRRAQSPGATYFFTVALADRTQATLIEHIDTLRRAYARTHADWPFHCDAFVVLPDHLHAVWTLPDGDADYSTRWRLIKARFTRGVLKSGPRGGSASQRRAGERGVWQRRFWEHQIRDARDYNAHLRYCWGNPVKHGYVARANAWPFSSIHRDIREGLVDPQWNAPAMQGAFGEPRKIA